MTNVLLIIFIISLLYVSIANRIITYVRVLALQGFILFGVTFLQLQDIKTWNLVLILLETIVFKAVAVPVFLSYLIKEKQNYPRNGTIPASFYIPDYYYTDSCYNCSACQFHSGYSSG